MICKNCGAQNTDTAKFCRRCGSALIVESKPKKEKDTFTKIIIWLIVIVVLAITGILGYFLIATGIVDLGGIIKDQDDYSISVQDESVSKETIKEEVAEKPTDKPTEKPTEQPTESPTEKPTSAQKITAEIEYETAELEDATYFSKATASSVLPNELQYNYKASNVLNDDGTCWCENSSGYGVGEWIKLELPYVQRVNGLELINGYAGSEKQYNYNSKISEVLIEFSNGQSLTVDLVVFDASQRKSVQFINFSQPVETSYVKITIKDVDKGDCEDTCLTYVAPY